MISIGLMLIIVLFLYLLFFAQQMTRTLHEGLLEQGEGFATNLGFSSELGVLAGDPILVEASIAGILERKEVAFAAVYNRDGNLISERGLLSDYRVLSESLRENISATKKVLQREIVIDDTEYHEFFAPVVVRTSRISETGEVIGFTRVIISLDEIQEKQERFFVFYFFASVIIFFLAGSIVAYMTRRMTRSIDALMGGAQSIGQGQLESRILIESEDEFGRLADAFNGMANRLQEGRDREEGVSRMKSEFLSITAHQLRTPLSALKWVLHMALEGDGGKLTKEQRELLHKGYESNERMINLVNDLLDVVRIEEGRFDYKFRKVDLQKLIEGIVEDMQILAGQKGVELTCSKSSNAILELTVDSEKLSLVIMNIVDNAIQYTPKGKKIIVEIGRTNEALIVVRDQGIGIPKNQAFRVFTKFFRADNAVRMQTAGSGLGLFIAKNIIEKHGGKIWIESEEGKGTSVYFTIPISHLRK